MHNLGNNKAHRVPRRGSLGSSRESNDTQKDESKMYRRNPHLRPIRRGSIPKMFLCEDERYEFLDQNPDEIKVMCKYDLVGKVMQYSCSVSYQHLSRFDIPATPDETFVYWRNASNNNPPFPTLRSLMNKVKSEPFFFAESIESQVLSSMRKVHSVSYLCEDSQKMSSQALSCYSSLKHF